MADRGRQVDMAHTLTTHFRASNFYTAFITDDAFKTHTFVFTAITLPVFGWPKDTLTEETVFFWLECPIIDCFRLRNLTIAPTTDLLGAGKADADSVKIIYFEHYWSPSKPDRLIPSSGI